MTAVTETPWPVALHPATLSSFAHPTRTMTLPTLWQSYQALQSGALNMNRFALAFWRRVSYPWVGLVMILLAVPFVTRNPGVGAWRRGSWRGWCWDWDFISSRRCRDISVFPAGYHP